MQKNIFLSIFCPILRFFHYLCSRNRAENLSKKKRGTRERIIPLIVNVLKILVLAMQKANMRIVPIKAQGAGYENREESASESKSRLEEICAKRLVIPLQRAWTIFDN